MPRNSPQQGAHNIPEDRPLAPAEERLLEWLLAHGSGRAAGFLPQLEKARVVSRCSCGCASVDLSIGGRRESASVGLEILADFQWRSAEGHLFGVFAYARGDLLSGLEVWSVDGEATPDKLPNSAELSESLG